MWKNSLSPKSMQPKYDKVVSFVLLSSLSQERFPSIVNVNLVFLNVLPLFLIPLLQMNMRSKERGNIVISAVLEQAIAVQTSWSVIS